MDNDIRGEVPAHHRGAWLAQEVHYRHASGDIAYAWSHLRVTPT